MTRKNPISARKRGDYYQELWVVKLGGEWIKDPDMYQWIHFEKIPDETDQKSFYLDDIVVLKKNEKYDLYQTKHKQSVQNNWTWDELLKPLPTTKQSLLKKWAHSLFRGEKTGKLEFFAKIDIATFITNANAEDNIQKYLKDKKINIEAIKQKDPELYASIKSEIGEESLVNHFFNKFNFCFGEKSEDELKTELRIFFNDTLCVTGSGFKNLLDWIREQSQKRRTLPLKLEDIKKECEFDTPRPLDEDFEIPADFEFFDNKKHAEILSELKNPRGGVKVFYGKPGVGKSVYLSKLDKELNEAKIISIKHHYHITPEDTNPQERLNAERAIEAVKAQFRHHKEELGEIANKNSKNIRLSAFINQVAKKSKQNNKSLIIIIDGLDHVLRYGNKEELEGFLKEICLPQPNVWIVIGMQIIAKKHLPQIIFDKSPESEWIEIKGLSRTAVSKLLLKNTASLNLPKQNEQYKVLLEKIYTLTSGNPLHLRYTLKQLKNQSGNTVVTEYSCTDLIPYSDNIEKYYAAIWRQISNNAKTLLLTVVSVNFLFTEKQLIECVYQTSQDPSDISEGFSSIAHLVSWNYRKQISVYHNSFEVYLKNTTEYGQQKIALKGNVKSWLKKSGNEYLKWAELRLIEYELGNNDPLLEIDREWLIEAVCFPSNLKQIDIQMERASKVAFEKQDYARALHISYLRTHYTNSQNSAEEADELIREESLQQNDNVFEYIDSEKLSSASLKVFAAFADSKGEEKTVKEIIDVLIKRLEKQEYRQGSIPGATAALLEVIPYDRTHEVERIYKYIIKFRDLGVSGNMFSSYSSMLLALSQKSKIEKLLTFSFTKQEEQGILVQCAKYGFENPSDDITSYFENKSDLPLICILYCNLKNKSVVNLPDLPDYAKFPETIPEHDSAERSQWKRVYYDNFLTGILYCLSDKKDEIEQWIKDSPDIWPIQAMSSLFTASFEVAAGIKKAKIDYTAFFYQLSTIQELRWPEDRESLTLQHAFSDALELIFDDLILYKEYIGDSYIIELSDYNVITQRLFLLSKHALLNLQLNSTNQIFSPETYKKIKDENLSSLADAVNYFPDRAKDYANMAKLARRYNDEKGSRSLLKKAVNNLLGYGYHKDIYLFDVLEAIGFCAKSGLDTKEISRWISRLIPLIENVGDYTDGDETSHLPFELAAILAKQNKELLYKNYYFSADKEDLYDAEKFFKYILGSLSFSDDEEIALASTALDAGSLSELQNIAQNNHGAMQALNKIQNYLGKISYPKEPDKNSSFPEKATDDYSKIRPKDLLNHLTSSFEDKWSWTRYFEGWLDHWLKSADKESLYFVVKQVIDKLDLKNISGPVLDKLYPLAYEFDNGAAFELLCIAQINDHGWQRYWTDKKKAENRWAFVKKKYPKRYLEFFHKSAHNVPLSLGVEYLLLFGDSQKAEVITEASVAFAESLMADIRLPVPEWQKSSNKVTIIDLLIQRLLWPSTLVQERATTALAELLCTSKRKKSILKHLLVWINKQKLEAIVVIGLLPIIKAFYICKNKSSLSYLNFKEIVKSLPLNSVVIERLIEELALLMKQAKIDLPDYSGTKTLPQNYSVGIFFLKYVQAFVAPIYMQRAEKIEASTGRAFIKLWAFTFDEMAKQAGIRIDSNQIYYYGRRGDDDMLIGFSSKVSQVYRSSFLRIIQQFYQQGLIPEDRYLKYAYATLPIELSNWKVSPNVTPKWWPELIESGHGEKENLSLSISLKTAIETLVDSKEGNQLIAAEGAIKPHGGWQHDPLHSFKLVGFGYKIVGSEIPSPEEIADEILHSPVMLRIPTKTDKPFHFLEDQNNYVVTEDKYIQIKDILIYPLVVREKDLCIGLWQYFRGYDTPFNLNISLTKNLKLELNDKSWIYKNKAGQAVCYYSDWLSGLKERYPFDMPLHHGQYLTLDKSVIDQWLKEKGFRLGYVLKKTYRVKKHSHDKVQKYDDIRLLKFSRIILP